MPPRLAGIVAHEREQRTVVTPQLMPKTDSDKLCVGEASPLGIRS
jgi:hypothetical protein